MKRQARMRQIEFVALIGAEAVVELENKPFTVHVLARVRARRCAARRAMYAGAFALGVGCKWCAFVCG